MDIVVSSKAEVAMLAWEQEKFTGQRPFRTTAKLRH
jgi:hypothetical protein